MADEAAVPAAVEAAPAAPVSPLEQRIADLTAIVERLAVAKAAEAAAPVVQVAAKPGLAIRAWLKTKSVASALKGARTLLFFGVTALVGLADAFSAIDLSSLSEHYIGTKIKFGDIITVMSVAGILLRFITKTPAFARWQKAAESGGVDEPTDAA